MYHAIGTEDDKPEIISFYNATKAGVDALDEKCTKYNCTRRSRRWPLTIFYTLLNISLVNGYVLFSSFPGNPAMSRYEYIRDLSLQLMEAHLLRRLNNCHIPRPIRQAIGRILDVPIVNSSAVSALDKRTRCSRCPRSSNRQTKVVCAKCQAPICTYCQKPLCEDCV